MHLRGTATGRLSTDDRADANVNDGASEPPTKDDARIYRASDFRQPPEFFHYLQQHFFTFCGGSRKKYRNL
jgi:hypothetical protein